MTTLLYPGVHVALARERHMRAQQREAKARERARDFPSPVMNDAVTIAQGETELARMKLARLEAYDRKVTHEPRP